jgi:hypothetical protein
MLDHLLVETATLYLPLGTYTDDGQPEYAAGVSVPAASVPMTQADRDAFGNITASTVILVKYDGDMPHGLRLAVGGKTYDVKGIRKCARLGSADAVAWRCAV